MLPSTEGIEGKLNEIKIARSAEEPDSMR